MAGLQFPQFNQWEPTLDGVEGNFQAEPRVFVHNATNVVLGNVASLYRLFGGDSNSGFVDGTTYSTTSSGSGKGLTLKVKASGGIVQGVEIIEAGGQDTTKPTTYSAYVINETITIASPGAGADATLRVSSIDIPNTEKRGACLYVGVAMDVGVVLESGAEVTFKSVPAGSFLPILVKRVSSAPTATGDIIALY